MAAASAELLARVARALGPEQKAILQAEIVEQQARDNDWRPSTSDSAQAGRERTLP